METDFSVQTKDFSGPLDLLLDLIEQRKLFIGDVSLAAVSDDFLEHINSLETLPVRSVAHFLVVASTLLLIKSRALLPYVTLTEEEEEDITELEMRLKIYKQIKAMSALLKKQFGTCIRFESRAHNNIQPTFAPDNAISTTSLHNAIHDVIQSFPVTETVPETIVSKVLSLEEMIDSLTDRIQKSLTMNFSEMSQKKDIANPKEVRLHIIVSFLAVLELVKKGIVETQQATTFDDIAIAHS